jgi:hypothetical protein
VQLMFQVLLSGDTAAPVWQTALAGMEALIPQ